MRALLLSLLATFCLLSPGIAGTLRTAEEYVGSYNSPRRDMQLAGRVLEADPDFKEAKKATVRLSMPYGTCSGTVMDTPEHNKILTSKHCLRKGLDGWIIEAQTTEGRTDARNVNILHVDKDEDDGAILTTDLYFTYTAKFGPRPKQGDLVFSHGNPDGYRDILVVGRVAGWVDNFFGSDDVMLLDRNDWYGMSGSAIFDRNGLIVGVTSAIFPWPNEGWRLTAVMPLTFTDEQLAGTSPVNTSAIQAVSVDELTLDVLLEETVTMIMQMYGVTRAEVLASFRDAGEAEIQEMARLFEVTPEAMRAAIARLLTRTT